MKWQDAGRYGRLCREIINETGSRAICHVWTRQNAKRKTKDGTEPWPQGEINFRLILNAPKMLEALEEMTATMSAVLFRIRRQETIESQLGTTVTKRVEYARALAQTAIAAVNKETNT